MTRALLVLFALLAIVGGCSSSSFDIGGDDAADVGELEAVAGDAGPTEVASSDAGELEAAAETATPDAMAEASPDVAGGDAWVTLDVDLPSSDAIASCIMTGPPTPANFCGTKGQYLEQTIARAAPIHRVTVSLHIDDQTSGCTLGATHGLEVKLDDATIGALSFTTTAPAPKGPRTVAGVFTLAAPVAPAFGKTTLRLTLTDTFCMGGGSFTWRSGGTVRFE